MARKINFAQEKVTWLFSMDPHAQVKLGRNQRPQETKGKFIHGTWISFKNDLLFRILTENGGVPSTKLYDCFPISMF